MDTEVDCLLVDGGKGKHRRPTWCRGIDVVGNNIFTTLDGRYGQKENNFKIRWLQISEAESVVKQVDLTKVEVDDNNAVDYITGFDVYAEEIKE